MAKKIYDNLNKGAFWVCLVTSITLIMASFCIPPYAVIDSSVLAAVGEIFAFATLATIIEGMTKGLDVKLTHNDTSVTFDNPDSQTSLLSDDEDNKD